jgi:hypothetical protein
MRSLGARPPIRRISSVDIHRDIKRAARAIDDYLKRSGIEIVLQLEVDNLWLRQRPVYGAAVSADNFLMWSVSASAKRRGADHRHKENTSPILRMFLSRIDVLTTRISNKARRMSGPGLAAAPTIGVGATGSCQHRRSCGRRTSLRALFAAPRCALAPKRGRRSLHRRIIA